jgi:hypothetical protein
MAKGEELMDQYTCAISGLIAEGTPIDNQSDDGDLPIGWTKITMVRRSYNGEWLLIQQVKERMVAGILSQMPDETMRAQEELAIRVQINAQFAAYEQNIPRYERDVEDVVYVSDAGDVMESLNEVRAMLGLEKIEEEDIEEEDLDEAAEVPAEGGAQ